MMASNDVVSVVVPCFNEERFILKCLQQLADQFDRDRYEIVVVDGISTDRTRATIETFRRDNPSLIVRLVDNPARNIPTALNLGIAASRGNIIARMDAHAVPSPDYIRRCVEVLNQTEAGVVGMACRVQPGDETQLAKAIAGAVSHPFGIGDAKYRLGKGGPPLEAVDTVAFSCFRKRLWQDLNGFNEELLTNEDYDFNFRVRQCGHKVILDRTGYCDYFARSTWSGLAEQYFRYGGWKAEMIRLHPSSIRMRHLIAPVFVLSILFLAILGIVWRGAWWLLLLELVIYVTSGLVAGLQFSAKSKTSPLMVFLMPPIFATIHFTWGGSFLLGVLGFQNHIAGLHKASE
jgi:glycosyltransferase involved in cell wall biosynthesis